jgi:hypothetical protein
LPYCAIGAKGFITISSPWARRLMTLLLKSYAVLLIDQNNVNAGPVM